jgi:hypothetical protein
MQNTVRELLGIERDLSLRIMGSTSMESNSEIWCHVIAEKSSSEELSSLARRVLKEMSSIARGRNDFVYAVFGSPSTLPGGISFRVNKTGAPRPEGWLAMRVRSRALVSSSELQSIAHRAAAVSVAVAHIADRIISPNTEADWAEKLPAALESLSKN